MENSALCYEVTEKVVQHIVHCVETQGRHVEYLKALQTLVKAEGQSIRKTQDMVMAEVWSTWIHKIQIRYECVGNSRVLMHYIIGFH